MNIGVLSNVFFKTLSRYKNTARLIEESFEQRGYLSGARFDELAAQQGSDVALFNAANKRAIKFMEKAGGGRDVTGRTGFTWYLTRTGRNQTTGSNNLRDAINQAALPEEKEAIKRLRERYFNTARDSEEFRTLGKEYDNSGIKSTKQVVDELTKFRDADMGDSRLMRLTIQRPERPGPMISLVKYKDDATRKKAFDLFEEQMQWADNAGPTSAGERLSSQKILNSLYDEGENLVFSTSKGTLKGSNIPLTNTNETKHLVKGIKHDLIESGDFIEKYGVWEMPSVANAGTEISLQKGARLVGGSNFRAIMSSKTHRDRGLFHDDLMGTIARSVNKGEGLYKPIDTNGKVMSVKEMIEISRKGRSPFRNQVNFKRLSDGEIITANNVVEKVGSESILNGLRASHLAKTTRGPDGKLLTEGIKDNLELNWHSLTSKEKAHLEKLLENKTLTDTDLVLMGYKRPGYQGNMFSAFDTEHYMKLGDLENTVSSAAANRRLQTLFNKKNPNTLQTLEEEAINIGKDTSKSLAERKKQITKLFNIVDDTGTLQANLFEGPYGLTRTFGDVTVGHKMGVRDMINGMIKNKILSEDQMKPYLKLLQDMVDSKDFAFVPTSKTGTAQGLQRALKNPLGYTPVPFSGLSQVLKDGGRVEYAEGAGPEGVQPIESSKIPFSSEVSQMMDLTGLDEGDSVLELMKDRAAAIPIKDRKKFASGGSVGGGQFGFEVTNKVGAVESLLSGIASGLIDIPKGAFTLGTSLLDLGFGTNNAAKVSAWFDDLTKFDEKAKEHWLGEIAKVGVNLGIPGYYGWKAGAKLAEKALLAKRNGNYFKLTDPALVEKFNTSLNAGGRLMATLGGAAGAGVTDAIFVGDPEGIGTFGDMVGGGPTELDPNDEKIASREIVNRMKFGLDGSLFLGLIGGTGSSIKSLYRRRNDLASNNDAIDKFLAAFRPRGRKSQEYFDMERRNIGVRATDINFASQEARKLDKHIDAIFPFIKNPFNQMGNKGRTEFMDKLNETLLSGDSTMNAIGKVEFGTMDKTLMDEVTSIMKSRGAKQKDIEGVFDSFEAIRGRWGRMFSRLGTTMDDDVRKDFAPLFAKKFKDYLGSTYEIFQNKSLLPLFRYKPTQESLEKVIKIFQESAKDAGKPITREQAEFYANQVVETAKLPRDLATAGEKTSGIYFNAPDFFANRTTLSEIEGRGTVALEDLINTDKKAFGELFGKVSDPMQTMLTGTNRLSLIARRNQFFNELLKSDELMTAERAKFLAENPGGVTPNTMRGFFRETEREAVEAFGQNIKQIDIDPSRTIEAGITNPLNGKYAEKGVAEAIEESSMIARDKSTLQQLYDSFVLYPKATSQMAKTILSPVTHVRNFISAGAFASSNGLFLQSPDEIAVAMKDAFKALQIPGSRMANDEYRKLLSLGVVNSNVRLGDLTKLLKDTNFGETVNSTKALRGLMRPLSKAKKWTEDMYTAEDDFWKITSYALERRRLAKSYEKYGINKTIDELDEEAADIIRNQIPNYDMVNDFIRATRKLPLGNFVSFPAEIMRTTANILQRGLKEVNYTHTLDDGRIVHPLRNIGYKRLFGLGTTVVAIPYGTVEAAKAIYDVTEDEMKALRRFVPDWSKNSTLVPIRGEDGELKYIDFSHANAYDTMIRPITALYTGIQRGMDEGEIGREVMKGMWEGTKETLSPFVSESIWTTAISDIFLRGGRTREGNRLWTDETPWGERINKAVMHAAKTQFPGSIETFKRMDLAIEPVDIIMRGKYDKYGQAFELGDELLGFAGMRAVKVDPLRAMKFKIADFRTGINNARREFTSPLLRGGPVTPEQIVDRYKVASEALYRVQEKMHRDYMAALTLGTGVESLDLEFADRVSNVQLDSIKRGLFKPFIPSENIEKAFRENAIAIGDADPYRRAKGLIERLIKLYDGMPLGLRLPDVNNPFKTSGIGNLPVMGSPAFQGLMNSPATAGSITVGAPNVQQQQQTAMAGQRVFGANDPIFGVG